VPVLPIVPILRTSTGRGADPDAVGFRPAAAWQYRVMVLGVKDPLSQEPLRGAETYATMRTQNCEDHLAVERPPNERGMHYLQLPTAPGHAARLLLLALRQGGATSKIIASR